MVSTILCLVGEKDASFTKKLQGTMINGLFISQSCVIILDSCLHQCVCGIPHFLNENQWQCLLGFVIMVGSQASCSSDLINSCA